MPATSIKLVEIIAPVEPELVAIYVIVIHLNVIIEDVPRHIGSVKAMAPRVESRRPEVHPQRLRLVHMIDRSIVTMHAMPNFMSIDLPADVVGRPFHLIDMPIIFWVETMGIFVALDFVMTVPVDHIHG